MMLAREGYNLKPHSGIRTIAIFIEKGVSRHFPFLDSRSSLSDKQENDCD